MGTIRHIVSSFSHIQYLHPHLHINLKQGFQCPFILSDFVIQSSILSLPDDISLGALRLYVSNQRNQCTYTFQIRSLLIALPPESLVWQTPCTYGTVVIRGKVVLPSFSTWMPHNICIILKPRIFSILCWNQNWSLMQNSKVSSDELQYVWKSKGKEAQIHWLRGLQLRRSK